jgi:hypothetical protein
VKQRVAAGERAPKGEEIKVTLATDPGPGFDEDTRVGCSTLIWPHCSSQFWPHLGAVPVRA